MAFANPLALLALLSLIPIVILYLIKPKPKEINIPSLMFIMDAERRENRYQTMLNKIVRDPLMLMQLLFLILLSLAMAGPYFLATETVRADHTAIILDASASMQAEDPNRFDLARQAAEKFVSGKTSIILAKNKQIVALQRGGRADAKDTLRRVQPGATTANIGDAIILAKSMIEGGGGGGEKGAIVVISDFANVDLGAISASKMLANAAGIDVVYKQVGNDADNIGITYGKLERNGDKYKYFCNIKNYMDDTKTVPVEVFRNGKNILGESVTIPAHSSELFALTDLAPGATVVALQHGDALSVDDRAYIAIPEIAKRKILFVSENANPPAKIAIGSLPDTECSLVKPLVLPEFGTYDIVVIGNITKGSLLPGTFNKLASFVGSGGDLVILASDGIGKIETEGLLPVGMRASESAGSTDIDKGISTQFTKDIAFDDISVTRHLKTEPLNNSIVTADDGSSMLAYQQSGAGVVLYSGFGEGDSRWNDFHTRVDYPIFWRQVVDWMSGVLGIDEYNVKTGRMYPLGGEQDVGTPSEAIIHTDNLLFDECGGYRIGNMDIAANLYDPMESDLSVSMMSEEARTLEPDLVKAEVEKELWSYLILLVMFLAGFELYYLRARGEL